MFNKKIVLGAIVLFVALISGCATQTHPPKIVVKETHIKDQGRNYAYCDNCLLTATRS